eukprot:Opistho-2@57030
MMAAAKQDEEDLLSSEEEDEEYAPSDAASDSDSPAADTDDDLAVQGNALATGPRTKRKRADDALHKSAKRDSAASAELKADENPEKKARIESLWDSFKKDVAPPKAAVVSTAPSELPPKKPSRFASMGIGATASSAVEAPKTVTKTFSFAGETISVTEKVSSSTQQQKPAPPKSALDDILSKFKPPKISTLEKSRLDWQTFKQAEGIDDELTHHNKDGYLEKKAFLDRADERQWETERAHRMGPGRRAT